MGFRNPILAADALQSGDLAGTYTVTGTVQVVSPGTDLLVEMGSDVTEAGGLPGLRWRRTSDPTLRAWVVGDRGEILVGMIELDSLGNVVSQRQLVQLTRSGTDQYAATVIADSGTLHSADGRTVVQWDGTSAQPNPFVELFASDGAGTSSSLIVKPAGATVSVPMVDLLAWTGISSRMVNCGAATVGPAVMREAAGTCALRGRINPTAGIAAGTKVLDLGSPLKVPAPTTSSGDYRLCPTQNGGTVPLHLDASGNLTVAVAYPSGAGWVDLSPFRWTP